MDIGVKKINLLNPRNLREKKYKTIFPLLWLALLVSPLLYAAPCPTDSVIGYDQNSNPISKTLYQYDEAGRTIMEENWYINSDSILIGTSKTTTSYNKNGKKDSVATWEWSTAINPNGWIGIECEKYKYDENGNIILWAKFSWDISKNDWTNKTKTEYEYKNQYKKTEPTLTITYTGNGNQWIPTSKQEKDYNAKYTILDRTYNSYDSSTKTWIGDHWYEYQYNSSNQLLLSKKYSWDTTKGDWKGETLTEYGYNAAGKQTLYIYYTWDATTSTFIGSSKTITDYDQWTNTILREQYTYNVTSQSWQGTQKIRYEYTAYNSDPIMTATFQWDNSRASFIGVDSIRTASDEAKNQILDEHYTYNVTNQAWVGTLKEEKIYDASKNIISKKTYQWQSTQWIYATKDSSAFDANKNKILEEHYTWNTTDNYWVGTGEKHVSKYTNNMETLQEVYIWDTDNKDWTYKSKIIKEYDGTKLTLDEEYALKGDILEGTKKEKYAYNAKGETILTVKYSWLHDNVWQGADSILANYDTRKNQILDERYTYNVTSQSWQGTTKWEAAYDATKNQTMDAQYEWDMTNQAWVGISKKEYAFNSQKQQIMFATYKWQDGTWVGTQKEERELDDEGREILVASYKWGSSTWVGKSRVVTTYYKDKLIASLANYDWKSNKWVGKDSTLYTYNTADLQTSKIVMLYQSSAWVNSTKIEQAYNESNILYAKSNFTWQSNTWQPIDKWEAHFDLAGRMDLDSTMVYKNSTWIYLNRNTNTYDTQDRLTLIMTENWANGIPSTGSKTENTYGEYGLTHTLTSEMQSSTWVALTQKENTYNTAGQLTQTLDQKNTESGWQTTHLYQASYDGDKPTQTIDQQYAEGAPVSGTRIAYEYTATENIETTSIWEGGNWVEQTRIGYYQSGNLSIETHYTHDGTQWVGNTKVEATTIGKNKEIATYQWQGSWAGISKVGTYYDEYEDETSASWNWKNNTWVCNTKKGESQYADGKLKSQTTYKIVSNTFVFNSRVEYEYGTGDKDKTTATYTYNTTSQSWQGVSKSGVTYSGSNKTSETTYTWLTGFTWQPNQKKEYEYGSHPSDLTTATYTYNTTSQSWQGVSKSGVTYASTGKQASEFSYVWGAVDSITTDWLPVSKTEWAYGSGKDNSVATYKGVDTAWVGVSKYSEQYTEHGDSLGFYTYCWKNDTWSDSLKREFTYNEYGDIIQYIDASWSGSSWTNKATSTKWEVTYYDYEKGLTTLDAHYYWNISKNKWYSTGNKEENQYDELGHRILYIKYKASGTTWIGSNKQVWEYDSHENLILEESYVWYSSKSKFRGLSKNERGFDENNHQIMTASYTWNMTKWKWEGVSKYESIINTEGNKEDIIYAWNSSSWNWQPSTKTESITNEQGLQIALIKYNYQAPEWVNYTKDEWKYNSVGVKIGSYSYDWENSQWVLYHAVETKYDENSDAKLRVGSDATWSSGILSSYSEIIYYYHCDPKFTITVNTSEEGVGEVTGGGVYTYYARPKIAAIESPGCDEFHQWSDGDTLATRRILVTGDKTYTAHFTPVLRTIRASVKNNLGGSVSVAIKQEE